MSELVFKPYRNIPKAITAAKLEEAQVIATTRGAVPAHPGDYVILAGEAKREHLGPHEDGEFGFRSVGEQAFEVMEASEFEELYQPVE